MKKRLIIIVLSLLLIVPMAVYAERAKSVTVWISGTQTFSRSAWLGSCLDKMEYDANNASFSERELFANCFYSSGVFHEEEINYIRVPIGSSKSYEWTIAPKEILMKHLLELDPVGIGTKGCSGKGTLYD